MVFSSCLQIRLMIQDHPHITEGLYFVCYYLDHSRVVEVSSFIRDFMLIKKNRGTRPHPCWTPHLKIYIIRITAAEMRFVMRTAVCPNWDLKWIGEKMDKRKTEPELEYIDQRRQNWRDHINRMDRIKISKKFCNTLLAAEDMDGVWQNVVSKQ